MADDTSYSGITKVETIQERQAGQGADDAWYVGLLANQREIGRVFASRERAQAARSQLTAWIEGGSRGESRVSWSSWPSGIGLMSFGVVWLVVVTVMERAKR